MTVTVEDYISVDQRVKELGCCLPTKLAVIPIRFESAAFYSDLFDASHTSTVLKFFKKYDVPVASFFQSTEPLPYVVNKHFQWLGPTLFIPLALLSENPQIVSLAIGVLGNCITDFFKGIPIRQRNVKLDMVVETTKAGTYKKLTYEGDVEGLRQLPQVIQELSND
jgi:hypothetical protein